MHVVSKQVLAGVTRNGAGCCTGQRTAAEWIGGSSLTCTAASTIAGDTSKYLFADDVHLTPFGNQLLAQFVSKNMATAGWQ